MAARAGNLPYDPARIACPVAVVRGEWDSRATDADIAGFKAALTRCPSFTDAKLERGTHLMHLETGRTRLWAATRNALAESKRAPIDTHAVIFEVHPSKEGRDEYLATARALRPLLDEIDGFVSIERFESSLRQGWILSLSLWADEAAIAAWRSRERHHAAQEKGRSGVFEDYRLRVSHALFDSGIGLDRQPPHPSAYNDPSRRKIGYLGLVEIAGEPPAAMAPMLRPGPAIRAAEAYRSLTNAKKAAYLVDLVDWNAAQSWRARMERAHSSQIAGTQQYRFRILEVLRDYGMFDRAQAPQFHPPANRIGTAA
jgi:heme-degrading monooxygenase HmoA